MSFMYLYIARALPESVKFFHPEMDQCVSSVPGALATEQGSFSGL